ncbi:MAG: DUF1800 domain-containing protein [Rhodanobacteraceae bacterium]|jgi:uncharacterized protein (DUF1800 family)|nr:DUF1800 domain-containing protein [Rhodanobacteraceae bacterium]
MAAPANAAFVASRRRLFTALAASTGAPLTDPALAMRRPGRDGMREAELPTSPQALTFPPSAVRWLTRTTFGFSTAEHAAFLALGANDDARWLAWLTRQLDPAAIADTACDARLAGAGFTTLGKSANQLWTDHHASSNYYTRMLPVSESECATLIRQTYSQRQLYEVMVDFWHDHFSVFGWDYDGGPMFPAFDRDAIRPYGHALGNFRAMLEAVGKSASMMYMLDLYANEAGHPNENYARELLELHTLGAENYAGIVPNPDSWANMQALGHFTAWDGEEQRLRYVDDDVYEAARALTGWTVSGANWPYTPVNGAPLGDFAYDDTRHDQLTKHVLARYFAAYQRQADGLLLFDMLAQHPGTARFVAGKLCRRFVGDNAPAALVQDAAELFQQQWQAPDQIAQVLRLILQSDAFKTNWGTKMKRPALAAVSALRATGADFTPVPDNTSTYTPTKEFVGRLQAAGHRLFYWPAPNGYPDDQVAWSSTGTLGMTLKLLPRLLEMHQVESYNNANPFLTDIQAQTLAAFPDPAGRSAAAIIGYWCDRILGYRPEPLHTAAIDLLRQNAAASAPLDLVSDDSPNGQPARTGKWNLNNLSQHYTIARLRTAVALILCSPEFLRR